MKTVTIIACFVAWTSAKFTLPIEDGEKFKGGNVLGIVGDEL
jgi:hypothetical protein